jgi:peptidoglycan hydrolase-like protein with peptidoglycan-binding domain
MLKRQFPLTVLIINILLFCGGCDLLLQILQREAAEEKRIFADLDVYNAKVQQLQKILIGLGYNPGPIDGRMGFKTRAAVKEFQDDYGLKKSGYVDKKTWEELNTAYQQEVSSLKRINIRQIQTALENAGFSPGPIDGKMGRKTKEAIKKFQEANGLTPDGKVGRKTWSKLREYLLLDKAQ